MKRHLVSVLLASTCFAAAAVVWAPVGHAAGEIKIVADDIGGVVKSAKGPEAGVWVVAETDDLGTKFIKIVTTDDKGQYVLPDLPKATYKVWVRGYGLVDSEPVKATPGNMLDLKAVIAPDAKTAAEYYPPEYWFALAKIPKGDMSNDEMAASVKQCMQCHQIGDKITRTLPPATMALGTFKTSLDVWDRRTKSGPAGGGMSGAFQALGAQRVMMPDWTDAIAKGAYPMKAPPRPTGAERNVVVTMWDWGNPTTYSHDSAASDARDPTINANGLIYGPGNYDGAVFWVDPIKNTAGSIPIPSTAPKGGLSNKDGSNFAKSPIWGDEPVWYDASQPRSSAVDQLGRAWVSARIRPTEDVPAFCKAGSTNKYAQYFPMTRAAKQVAFFDPKTQKVTEIDTCFTTDHNQFADTNVVPGNAVFFGQNDTIGWVYADTWDKTQNAEQSQGWAPIVIDTSGDGKISKGWTEPDEPVVPGKDHRVHSTCYSIAVSPKDGSIWCSGIGATATKLTRLSLGSNPPETMIGEQYSPPPGKSDVPFLREGGVDVGTDGVVYQNWRGSDQITAFDRSKCKVLNGPQAADPQHCPEGWTVYRRPNQPNLGGTKLYANMMYLIEVDRHNVLGFGENAVVTYPTNSNAVQVLIPKTGKWVTMNLPYPMGFMGRNVNWRVDNSTNGWKGRGMWSSFSDEPIWHIEGGKGQKAKAVKFQVRPDPLAD